MCRTPCSSQSKPQQLLWSFSSLEASLALLRRGCGASSHVALNCAELLVAKSPTELAVEFAELPVEVAVASWSRFLTFVGDLQPPSWPMTTAFLSVRGHLAVLARRGSPRSLARCCRKRINELV